MKIKNVAIASALAAAIGTGAISAPASAGCAVVLAVHNVSPGAVTIDWDYSEVRTKKLGVVGPWRTLGTGDTYVSAGTTSFKAMTLPRGCNVQRQYRLATTEVSGNWWSEFHPWTRDRTPQAEVDGA